MADPDAYEHRARPPRKRRQRPQRVGLVNATNYIRPCVCGGEIVATRLTEDDLTAAVHQHRQTIRHRAWARAWHGEG